MTFSLQIWHALSGMAHVLQAIWPHWNAVSFFRSMQIEHIWASSSACILFNSLEKSFLLRFNAFPLSVSFSWMAWLHSMHRFNRILQSKHTILCWQGENVIEQASSSHNLHLSFFVWMEFDESVWLISIDAWGL